MIAESATRAGFKTTALDISPVATLIARARTLYPCDPTIREPAGAWTGLAHEVAASARRVLDDVRSADPEAWMADDVEGIIFIQMVECPHCGQSVPRHPTTRLDQKHAVVVDSRGAARIVDDSPVAAPLDARCGLCDAVFGRARLRAAEFLPVARRRVGAGRRGWEVLATPDLPNVPDDGAIEWLADSTFTMHRDRDVSWIEMTSPRQRLLLGRLVHAARLELASRNAQTLPEGAWPALATYLGLLVSGTLPLLTRATRLRSDGNVMPGLGRHEWAVAQPYVDVGGRVIERAWDHRLRELATIVETCAAEPVAVDRGDALRLPYKSSSFDLVVWDPPYYDIVDYDALAYPFEQVIRAVLDTHPDLAGEPVHRSARVGTARSMRDDVSTMAAEAARVVTPGGNVGVWWQSRSVADLDEFVDAVALANLELQTAVWVDRTRPGSALSKSSTSEPRMYLLVFKRALGAVGVDSRTVLALADARRANLYHGLADILEAEFEANDLIHMLGSDSPEEVRRDLIEYVATNQSPEETLREIGRPALQRHAQRLAANINPSMDAIDLAWSVLGALGFSIPEPPTFSIEAALDRFGECESRLALESNASAATAPFTEMAHLLEASMKLTARSWASVLGDDQWLEGLLERASRKDGENRPRPRTLGDWKNAFSAVVKELRSHPTFESELRHSTSLVRKFKAVEAFDRFVNVRNRIAHPDRGLPPVDEMLEVARRVAGVLNDLVAHQALPVVLAPQEQRFDRLGRIVLVAFDGRRRQRELHVADAVDLTHPIVWIPRGKTPREVSPLLVPFVGDPVS